MAADFTGESIALILCLVPSSSEGEGFATTLPIALTIQGSALRLYCTGAAKTQMAKARTSPQN